MDDEQPPVLHTRRTRSGRQWATSMQDPGERKHLLAAVAAFIHDASAVPGVERIAVVGSLTTGAPNPKDADVLVTIGPHADLEALALHGRRLLGKAQSRNRGADIFLADSLGHYLGRLCSFRECHMRAACNGRRCAKGNRIRDDVHVLRLSADLIANPPVIAWPTLIMPRGLPADLVDALSPARPDVSPGT